MSSRKIAVFWNDQEKLLIAKEYRRLVSEGRKPNSTTLTDANRAVLPATRQRVISSLRDKHMQWLQPMLSALNKEALVAEQPVTEQAKVTEQAVSQKAEAEVEVDAIQAISFLVLEALKPHLRKVVEQVVDGGITYVKDSIQVAVKDKLSTYSAQPEKIRKRKVVVVGPYNSEATKLHTLFDDSMHLNTYNKDKSLQTLKKMLSNADEVVVMTDHCTHAATSMIKAVYKGKSHLVGGGYSSLHSKLTEIASTPS